VPVQSTGKKPKRSSTFADLTFYLSGFGRDESASLAELISRNGGVVESQIPDPTAPAPFTPSPPAGAPCVDPDPAEYTRVVTPAAGRTLKCLYASAIGAPLVTPAWVKESVKALKALSPGSTPPGSIISRGSHHGRSHRGEGPDGGNGGARLFAGLALALSGDDGFHKQFGALLTHAGATVVDSNELIDDDEDEANRCDLVVVQESALERKGFKGSTLRRAAERHGVPCVWHPWAVESLLAGDQQGADGFLAVK
jgi:hypothetical protein